MKRIIIYLLLIFTCNACCAQSDFIGIVKYKLAVLGGTDTNTDSMSVVFDKERVMVILYLPDGNKISQQLFLDDFKQNKSYRIDKDKHTYQVDSLRTAIGYEFKNSNSIGAVNNALCMRYKADLTGKDKSQVSAAECLAAIDYRKSSIKDYSFLGVQPIVVDNRIVMDFTVNKTNGTRPNITVSDIRKMDNVETYFDLKNYQETR
jgi:hypothetical protein